MTASADEARSNRQPPRIAMRGVTKRFPGVIALDAVDFTLRPGEIHALMGENGAGKSTLIKVLTGVHHRDAGEIGLDGVAIDPRSPIDAQRLGISTVYQEVNLIPHLSVAENIALGRQPMKAGRIDWRRMKRRANELLERMNVSIDVTQPLTNYSIAIQQMVAIARALDVDARVLILDEPTSSLDRGEVTRLFDLMRRLRNDGLGVIFITHFLDQVYEVSDRITVLRNGKLVGAWQASALPRLDLVAHMIGQSVEDARRKVDASRRHRRKVRADAPIALHARDLGRGGALEAMEIELHAGEITGLAGLLGSGRTELARLLFGIDRADSGDIEIDGRRGRFRSPRQAIRRGLAFCPEDRKSEGIIADLSVRENIALAAQARRGWLRLMPRATQRRIADEYIQALKIATPDADKPVGQLSGGNQQKVILARWLAAAPRVLIVDEPTRGIDVGAKAEIERLLRELCHDGMAVLFISSELDEVARDSHRVVVLRDRRKIGELAGDEIDIGAIMRMIAGDPNSRSSEPAEVDAS